MKLDRMDEVGGGKLDLESAILLRKEALDWISSRMSQRNLPLLPKGETSIYDTGNHTGYCCDYPLPDPRAITAIV